MSRRSSSRRSASRQPAFPQLPVGVQAGLERLVSDHQETVAQMLEVASSSATEHEQQQQTDLLCEKCASVMKQQQLSVSQFLARFFDIQMLQQHAMRVLEKSGKGSAAVLSERIEAAWLKGKPLILLSPKEDKSEVVVSNSASSSSDVKKVANRKRAAKETPVETETVPSDAAEKKKKSKVT